MTYKTKKYLFFSLWLFSFKLKRGHVLLLQVHRGACPENWSSNRNSGLHHCDKWKKEGDFDGKFYIIYLIIILMITTIYVNISH